jgi:hypothetical protein
MPPVLSWKNLLSFTPCKAPRQSLERWNGTINQFFGSTGGWTQSLMLARQIRYCLATLPALVIFEMGSLFVLRPAWTTILLFVLPWVARMTGASHCNQPLVEMGVGFLQTFCLGWPGTVVLLISSWNYRLEPPRLGTTMNKFNSVDTTREVQYAKVQLWPQNAYIDRSWEPELDEKGGRKLSRWSKSATSNGIQGTDPRLYLGKGGRNIKREVI